MKQTRFRDYIDCIEAIDELVEGVGATPTALSLGLIAKRQVYALFRNHEKRDVDA